MYFLHRNPDFCFRFKNQYKISSFEDPTTMEIGTSTRSDAEIRSKTPPCVCARFSAGTENLEMQSKTPLCLRQIFGGHGKPGANIGFFLRRWFRPRVGQTPPFRSGPENLVFHTRGGLLANL